MPIIQVSNLADLATLAPSEEVIDGCFVYVQLLRRHFVLDRSSSDAPLSGQRVSATGGGMWRSTRIFSHDSDPWSSRDDWHIDALNGSPENDGSSAYPLDSWRELVTRIGGHPLPPNSVISLHSSINEVVDASTFIPDPTTGLVITGEPGASVDVAAVVGTWAGMSLVGSGEFPILTSPGVPDWTAYQGKRIRFTTGAKPDAITQVSKSNPAGMGVGYARVAPPVRMEWPGFANATPSAGNEFVVETLPAILGYTAPRTVGNHTAPVLLRGVSLPMVSHPSRLELAGDTIILYGCTAGDIDIFAIRTIIVGCRLGVSVGAVQRVHYAWNKGNTYYKCSMQCGFSELYNSVVEGKLSYSAGAHFIGDVGVFDSTSSPIALHDGAACLQNSAVVGNSNVGYGIQFVSGSRWGYATKPIITASLGDFYLGGTGRSWSAAPFWDQNTHVGIYQR